MKRRLGRNSLLARYLSPYIVLLLMPVLLTSLFLFTYLKSVMEAQIIRNDTRILSQVVGVIDRKLLDMSNTFVALNNTSTVTMPTREGDTYAYYSATDALSRFLESNGIFSEVCWYNVDQGVVLSSSGVYLAERSGGYMIGSQVPLESFFRDAQAAEGPVVRGYGRTLVFYYPSGRYRYYPAHVVAFVVDMAAFLGLSQQAQDEADTYVFDEYGELVARSTSAKLTEEALEPLLDGMAGQGHTTLREGGAHYLVSYIVSNTSGWTYINASNRSTVLRTLITMEIAGALVLIAMALSGLVIIRYAMNRTYAPVKRLQRRVEAHSGGSAGNLESIIERVEDAYVSNRRLRRGIEEAQSLLQRQLFRSLVSGQVRDLDELARLLKQTGAVPGAGAYRVLLCGIVDAAMDTHEERDEVLSGVRDVLARDLLPNGTVLADSHANAAHPHWAFLLDAAAYPVQALESGAALVGASARDRLGIALSFALTQECADMASLRQGFFAARAAIAGGGADGALLLVSPAIAVDAQAVRDQRALVCALETALREGRNDEALTSLDRLMEAARRPDRMPGNDAYLGYDLVAALTRTLGGGSPDAEERFAALTRLAEAGDLTHLAEDARRIMLEHVLVDPEDPIVRQIKQCVAKGLSDPWFDIQNIATQLGYSYKYVSHYFRKVTGYRLSDYIARKRIERFKRELARSNEPIAALIRTVGYDNAATFNRVFKQYEGMTPGQYRQHLRAQTHASEDAIEEE